MDVPDFPGSHPLRVYAGPSYRHGSTLTCRCPALISCAFTHKQGRRLSPRGDCGGVGRGGLSHRRRPCLWMPSLRLSRRRSVKPKPSRRQSPSSCCAWAPSLRGAIRACSYPLYVSCRSAKPTLAGRLRTQKSFLTTGCPRSTRPRGFFRNVIATCQAGILTDPHEPTRSLRRTPCLHSLSSSLWCRLSYHSPLHTRSSEAIPFMGSIPFRDRVELRSWSVRTALPASC